MDRTDDKPLEKDIAKQDRQSTWNISAQQVQIFLKAVELRNFTQVAGYFNYTPSMISKTIIALERELGLTLFIRKPNELTPTPAGKYLANEWRSFIASLNNSVRRARQYQNCLEDNITFSFVDSSAAVDRLMSKVILSYAAARPDITISAEKHDMHRAAELLSSGMQDLILTSEIEAAYLEEHGLFWEKAFNTTVSAYVPRKNELFDHETVSFEDLKSQKLCALDSLMNPTYCAWLENLCGRYGFTPDVVSSFRTVRSLMFSLRLHDCIFIGDSITSDWCDEDVKMFRLPEKSFIILAWRDNKRAEIAAFKNYLMKMLSAMDCV